MSEPREPQPDDSGPADNDLADDEEEERGGRRRFTEDPLSMFLAFAAVLLGLMYYLEQTNLTTLQDASARAQQVGVTTLTLERCTTEAAGKGGTTLVVTCQSSATDAVERAAELDAAEIQGFDRVLFVGTDKRMRCPTAPSQWPGGCESTPHPAVAEDDPAS